jgi:3-methyladenine DNA glycosylase AlkD
MAAKSSASSIVAELERLGGAAYRQVLLTHGVREPVHGVKIADLKRIQKRLGGTDHRLALELWDTGVYDAMYFAGLLADDARMTRSDLQRWVGQAYCPMLAEYTVPWVASGGAHGRELGLKWIDSPKPLVAAAGWATLASLASITPDDGLDLSELKALLFRVETSIHSAPDRVRYTMNGFVIGVGSYVRALTQPALAAGRRMGTVHVDKGGTACKVPDAVQAIGKVRQRGTLGKKRRSAKC